MTDGSDATPSDDSIANPAALNALLRDRWQEPGPGVLTERHLEFRRLAASMRTIIERLSATAAPTEAIIAAADDLARVAATFDRLQPGHDYEGFSEAANVVWDPTTVFERSPFIGLANPLSPPLRLEDIDGVVHGYGRFGSAYEGPPASVHGGYVAAAFDEVLGAAQSMSGHPGMTGTLTVRYRRPTPLHTDLHFIGEFDGVERRKIFTSGRLFAGDLLCAEAEGIFIQVPPERFAELKDERDKRGS